MHHKFPILSCILVFFLLTSCAAVPPPEPTQTASLAPAVSDPLPTPEPISTPEPTSPPWQLYEFGVPLEESNPVEDDTSFDTAVFVGDSRTEGLQLFSGLKHGDFFWARGLTVFRAGSDEYRPFEFDGEKHSLMEALGLKEYESVYIMLGINELGYEVDSYESGLAELMDNVVLDSRQGVAVEYLVGKAG